MRRLRVLVLAVVALLCTTPAYASPTHDATLLEPLKVICQMHQAENDTVDALRARTGVEPAACDVACRAYLQTTGWQDWAQNGAWAGLANGGKRVEAVRMRLRGLLADDYRIWYRVRVAGRGWTGWAADGEAAGTMGLSAAIEDVEVRVQRAFEPAPEKDAAAPRQDEPALVDRTHVSQIGRIPSKRKVVPIGGFAPSARATRTLDAAIKAIRAQKYDVGFVMLDLDTHQGVAYNCGTTFYGASSIKAPYMAAAVERHPKALKKYRQQIQDTLTYSWDDTYKEVVRAYGEKPLLRWRDELKLDSDLSTFTVDNPWVGYTARDFAKLWVRIHWWAEETAEGATFCAWSEHPETSTIHQALGDRWRTQSKAGWIVTPYPYWNVSDDGGIVYADNGAYVLAILSSVPADFGKLHDLTRAIDAVHAEIKP